MESLCGEEIEEKKAVFGRCVIAETRAPDNGRRWIVVEVSPPPPLYTEHAINKTGNSEGSRDYP
jgi:hypothetical protein